ncbi:hypothetical protein SeSB_A2895 [Salmonella enterica subsp. enterica serovar Schwarzengrund str. SL480]|uniref:Uncharacterized protein n=1 Tax=Salmonella schwarzengrund (strain CVM19633) TaxID=439843 RepID=A0A0N1QZ17_SALSV|nr:hypothetical protein SeSA_A2721 [Salmonella enterica subsp. enterica serovar Schwarzengrund str. CVM19633]EDY28303.1 hypothetical protein SeSB_A2895 [Salmonella enterica subsp. enterica serovar Schwarzengrund str. SL480]CAI3052537.1 hypothetical protein [Salmonella enterica subsp. enterica serovar Bredeney]
MVQKRDLTAISHHNYRPTSPAGVAGNEYLSLIHTQEC